MCVTRSIVLKWKKQEYIQTTTNCMLWMQSVHMHSSHVKSLRQNIVDIGYGKL